MDLPNGILLILSQHVGICFEPIYEHGEHSFESLAYTAELSDNNTEECGKVRVETTHVSR